MHKLLFVVLMLGPAVRDLATGTRQVDEGELEAAAVASPQPSEKPTPPAKLQRKKGGGIEWGSDPRAAFAQAEEERRPILLLVSGGSCGGTATIGDPGSGAFQTECQRLEEDVLSKLDVVEAAARYVPLLLNVSARAVDGASAGEADLARRYHLATLPTLLLADPWGNEIVRLVGYTPRDKVLRLLTAIPADFAPLKPAAEVLRADPLSLPALASAAAFYEKAGLGLIAERYYERAAGTPAARDDASARRPLVLARGLNLLRLGQGKRAAEVFKDEADKAPAGSQADAVLFGWAMAELAQGHRDKASELSAWLARDFPTSPYAAKLQQSLAAHR